MPQDDDPRHDTRERLYRGAAVPDDARIGLATDIGLRHATNQDYAGIDFAPSGPYWVVVVADGVSSTPGAERASHIAATTICQHLTDALGDGRSHRRRCDDCPVHRCLRPGPRTHRHQ